MSRCVNITHPDIVSINSELDWNVYTCLTQLYDGRDMYIIYYIKNNYMFRHFSLAIFRLINKKIDRHMKVVMLPALRNGRLYPLRNIPGTQFC